MKMTYHRVIINIRVDGGVASSGDGKRDEWCSDNPEQELKLGISATTILGRMR
ncbi:hypothetical protein Hanom_Chr06g00576651 [Helianthus anomalus]